MYTFLKFCVNGVMTTGFGNLSRYFPRSNSSVLALLVFTETSGKITT